MYTRYIEKALIQQRTIVTKTFIQQRPLLLFTNKRPLLLSTKQKTIVTIYKTKRPLLLFTEQRSLLLFTKQKDHCYYLQNKDHCFYLQSQWVIVCPDAHKAHCVFTYTIAHCAHPDPQGPLL